MNRTRLLDGADHDLALDLRLTASDQNRYHGRVFTFFHKGGPEACNYARFHFLY